MEPDHIRPAGRAARALLPGVVLLEVALLALPVAYLLVRAAGADADAWDDLVSVDTLRLIARSVGLAAAVALTATTIAVPYAWLTVRCDLPARRLWAVLGALPLVIPSYVGALTLIGAFGPRGMLQGMLEPLGVERLPELYGFAGAYVALTLFTYPYVLLTVSSGLRRMDASLERAARGLGQSPLGAFVHVTLPQMRSSIAAGTLLCALYVLSDFGVVSLMRYPTFTREIFVHYRSLFDRTGAALLSLVLCVLTALVLLLERRARGAAFAQRRRVSARDDEQAVLLGPWKVPALGFVTAIAGAGVGVPCAVLAWWLARPAADADRALELREAAHALAGSLTASGIAAVVAVALALPIALLAVRVPGRLSAFAESASYAGFALPGIVAALGLVFFATRYAPTLYQTLALLVLAYVIRFLPQAVGASRAGIERVHPRLEAAARGMGMGAVGTFARVTLPIAAPSVLAGGVLVFLTAMKELPATLILRPTGFDTLATEVWQKSQVSAYSEAALPALLLVAISAVPLYALEIRRPLQRRQPDAPPPVDP